MKSSQISEEIKKTISHFIIIHLQSKTNCLITINHVFLNKNLNLAKIYYSILGSKINIKKTIYLIKKKLPSFKKNISQNIKLNKMPKLKIINIKNKI